LGQGWVCGDQFFRVSGHPFHPGMRFENGLGQVLGGQILSSPDKVGVNAAKQAREFQPPKAIQDSTEHRDGIGNRLSGPA